MTVRAVRVKDLGAPNGCTQILWLVGEGDVLTSAAVARTGPETFVFPCDEDGRRRRSIDLPGSLREADAHDRAIAGYVDSLNGEIVPLPEFTLDELLQRAFG